jgi:hypothetical protein
MSDDLGTYGIKLLENSWLCLKNNKKLKIKIFPKISKTISKSR